MPEDNPHLRTIEIDGVKLEIDLRTAKRTDTFKVGDRVKLLEKSQYGGHKVHHGVIVGFDDFPTMPAINVVYVDTGAYEDPIKLAVLTNDKKCSFEITADQDAIPFEKVDVLHKLDRKVEKLNAEVDDLLKMRQYFLDNYGKFFPAK